MGKKKNVTNVSKKEMTENVSAPLNVLSKAGYALYVRVSTEEQAKHGFSIAAQIDRLKSYCEAFKLPIFNIYMDDGKSGKDIDGRPEMKRLLKDIYQKKIKGVLVVKIDRLTRSVKDLITLVETFNEYGCDFISLQESIDTTTAVGRMFIKLVGIFAEWEREVIAERTAEGLKRKAKEGYPLWKDFASYGYDREKLQLIPTVNETEAKNVKWIFEQFVYHNKSLTWIAKDLNRRGFRTKRGKLFSHKSIKYILTNPIYIGILRYCRDNEERYQESESKAPIIIKIELFNLVQKKLDSMEKRPHTKRANAENYFTSVLYCGICGAKMTTHIKVKKRVDGSEYQLNAYRCPNKLLGSCVAKQVSHKKIEDKFKEYIYEMDFDKYDIQELDSNTYSEEQDNILELLEQYENELDRLNNKTKDLKEKLIADLISFEEFRDLKNVCDLEIKNIEQLIDELPIKKIDNNDELTLTTENIILNLKENWELLTDEEKQNFLVTFIDKIHIINRVNKDSNTTEGLLEILGIDFLKKE
ncbi:recombinase family protein [Lacrimispora brassicae]